MLIPTNDVPQADDLDLVARVADAVAHGARTYQDIARAIGEYDLRQGRYYRRAAEILGFVRNEPMHNRSTLTQLGQQFIRSTGNRRNELLAQAVVQSRLTQRIIPFLESHRTAGVSREQLQEFIGTVTRTTLGMVKRRSSTIIGWLARIGLVQEREEHWFLQNLPGGVELVDYAAPDEPLLPRTCELGEYRTVSKRVKQEIRNLTVLINEAARERASESHRMLTDLVANKIRAAGGIPKRNRFIDLAARLFDEDYLFEMKSTTRQNVHSQVRGAISQLYEYRYMHNTSTARLVVVIEHPLPRDFRWIVDYVVNDRKLLLAWDGDRRTLHYPEANHDLLRFLD